MSNSNAGNWLLSQNKFEHNIGKKLSRKAITVSVTSGKGGVGKTSISIKIARMLAEKGFKVLVIDCDYNLSNTFIKLNFPIKDDFNFLISGVKTFDECIYKDGNFHLLAACSGDLDLFDREIHLDQFILNLLLQIENRYDYIVLDSPAGINKQAMTINAYSDYRLVVVTPDKSSITDSYSLIKILNKKYGVKENHLIVNKISSEAQYKRIVQIMSETVENFLASRLKIMGGIGRNNRAIDIFDRELFDQSKDLHKDFCNIISRFTEESLGCCDDNHCGNLNYGCVDDLKHEVLNQ